jgi:hypothetical protein
MTATQRHPHHLGAHWQMRTNAVSATMASSASSIHASRQGERYSSGTGSTVSLGVRTWPLPIGRHVWTLDGSAIVASKRVNLHWALTAISANKALSVPANILLPVPLCAAVANDNDDDDPVPLAA